MAETIGSCVCSIPDCSEVAEVREMKGKVKGAAGRLYLFCPSCGVVRSSGQRFQDYITSKSDIKQEIEVIPGNENNPVPEIKKPDMWDGW